MYITQTASHSDLTVPGPLVVHLRMVPPKRVPVQGGLDAVCRVGTPVVSTGDDEAQLWMDRRGGLLLPCGERQARPCPPAVSGAQSVTVSVSLAPVADKNCAYCDEE